MRDEVTFIGLKPVSVQAQEGVFFDFLGAKTRISYFSEDLRGLSGRVFGVPERGTLIFFEFEEWQGVMAALRDANQSFTCLELGCGWGPWLVTAMLAARQLGIREVCLGGVEAEAVNLENLRTHFRDNGLDPEGHTLIHAAIDDHDAPAAPEHPGGAPLISLNTLLAAYPVVDLIHCDIQYAEGRAFQAGIDAVNERVKRIVIGTHSRKIEDGLIELFQGAGWMLECETPCRYQIIAGRAELLADGAQVWKNTRL